VSYTYLSIYLIETEPGYTICKWGLRRETYSGKLRREYVNAKRYFVAEEISLLPLGPRYCVLEWAHTYAYTHFLSHLRIGIRLY